MPFLPLLAGLWGNPLSRLVIIGVAAFGFGFLKGFQAVPKVDIAAIERNAISGRDAEWERKLAEAEQHNEKRIADAIEAGQSITISSDLVSLCNSSPDCRDKGDQRK